MPCEYELQEWTVVPHAGYETSDAAVALRPGLKRRDNGISVESLSTHRFTAVDQARLGTLGEEETAQMNHSVCQLSYAGAGAACAPPLVGSGASASASSASRFARSLLWSLAIRT